MSSARIVTILSPVFVALAGWCVVLAAKYLPGHPHLDPTQLGDLFIAGATAAAAQAAIFLHKHAK